MQSVFAQVCAAGNKWNNQKRPGDGVARPDSSTNKRDLRNAAAIEINRGGGF
jgi:hypothetical protein